MQGWHSAGSGQVLVHKESPGSYGTMESQLGEAHKDQRDHKRIAKEPPKTVSRLQSQGHFCETCPALSGDTSPAGKHKHILDPCLSLMLCRDARQQGLMLNNSGKRGCWDKGEDRLLGGDPGKQKRQR